MLKSIIIFIKYSLTRFLMHKMIIRATIAVADWHLPWCPNQSTFSLKVEVIIILVLKFILAHTDNHSVAHGLEKLNESGESSDETNSQDAEASDHEYLSIII
jgi:hypothetical protein